MSTLRINKRAYEPWFAIGALIVLRPRRRVHTPVLRRGLQRPLTARYAKLAEMLPQGGLDQRLARFIVD